MTDSPDEPAERVIEVAPSEYVRCAEPTSVEREKMGVSPFLSVGECSAVPAQEAQPRWEPFNEGGTMCPPDPELVDEILEKYPLPEPAAQHTGIGATPATQVDPDDKLNTLSLEWHGSGYVQKWEDFIFSKLLESYSDNAALADDLRAVREERDRLEKRYAFDMCTECDFPHVRISNGPTEYVCAYCDLLEKCDAAETALLAERELRKQAEEALRKIFDHDSSCGCDDHMGEDCCANQDPADYLCAACIAGRYFAKPVQEPTGRIEEQP